MDSPGLLDSATAQTGLDDFGDPSFREGLDILVAALNEEAALNDIGRPAAEAMLTGALANRLRVIDWGNRHPDVAEEEIVDPIFIVGVSRSGTTALSHLLVNDPRNRSLLTWEARDPIPPPSPDTYDRDPRLLDARDEEEHSMLEALNPGFKAVHHDPPDMPIECVTVMAHDMVSLLYPAAFNVDSYVEWVLHRDHRPTYGYHRRVLQILQSGGVRGRWQLKTPHHGLAVETIASVHPTARFIWTHREPSVCVASTASTVRHLSGTFSDADRRRQQGALWTRVLAEMLGRTQTARDRLGDDRFVDVSYTDLVADPVGTVTRLAADLGESVGPELAAVLHAHAAEHRQHRHGRHEYDFGEFGLQREALDERFSDYRARYLDA